MYRCPFITYILNSLWGYSCSLVSQSLCIFIENGVADPYGNIMTDYNNIKSGFEKSGFNGLEYGILCEIYLQFHLYLYC